MTVQGRPADGQPARRSVAVSVRPRGSRARRRASGRATPPAKAASGNRPGWTAAAEEDRQDGRPASPRRAPATPGEAKGLRKSPSASPRRWRRARSRPTGHELPVGRRTAQMIAGRQGVVRPTRGAADLRARSPKRLDEGELRPPRRPSRGRRRDESDAASTVEDERRGERRPAAGRGGAVPPRPVQVAPRDGNGFLELSSR